MEWLSRITAFDILILLIFMAFLSRGIWIGFICQISSLIGMIGGFILAGYFDNEFYRLILPYIENARLAFLLTYILLFVGFFYLIKLIGLGLKKVMDVTLTPWFDRTMGGIFGIIKGVFFISLLFILISSFLSGSNNYLKKSVSYNFLSSSSKVILAFIQDYDLRSYFIPKEPAIKLPSFKKS
ncbi:MAG: CvpA family protein [Deltaproteobacteria bacterium]|jgi:membrane protein required for colicin V production|nr:CvpA family protein [Deltaproteobacteria bacterium]